jgi:Flp pilus assembly protein TadD
MAGKSIASNVSRTSAGLSSFEGFDAQLRDALGRVAALPTKDHYVEVARAYRNAGIHDKAYDYLTRSLTLLGPDADVFDERARLWRDWGTPELGLADAHRALYLSPGSPALHNTLGTILYRIGQRDEAEKRFQQAVALDANAWYALSNLCHLNFARGRTREAIIQCRQATAVRNKQANTTR